MPITNIPSALFEYPSNSNAANFVSNQNQQYNVFTGADMTAYIGSVQLGKLQAITLSITRETMPVYTWGDASPKAFAKGKRGIAGSLVFTQFDRHAILRDVFQEQGQTVQNLWSTFNPNAQAAVPANITAIPSSLNFQQVVAQQNTQTAQNDVLETLFLVAQRKINFVDQLPPFDVTITMVNDQGYAATMSIYGIQLVNEGVGFSLDDLHSETAYTYLARSVDPLTNVDFTNLQTLSSSNSYMVTS